MALNSEQGTIKVVGAYEVPKEIHELSRKPTATRGFGIFPEIGYGWAIFDCQLFIWKLDTGAPPYVHIFPGQSLTTIRLITPRPGAFNDIEKILVACSTTEVTLLQFDVAADDMDNRILLVDIPFYSCSVTGVKISCIASTMNGRIFMGTQNDDKLYELIYNTGVGVLWPRKRCKLVCHSRTFKDYIPVLSNSQGASAKQLIVDENRNILYMLDTASKIHVFDIGVNGDARPSTVAECLDIAKEAISAKGGHTVFGGGENKSATTVVSLAILGRTESDDVHLVAMTDKGHQVYFSTYSSEIASRMQQRPSALSGDVKRPNCLKAVYVRSGLNDEQETGNNNSCFDRVHAVMSYNTVIVARSDGGPTEIQPLQPPGAIDRKSKLGKEVAPDPHPNLIPGHPVALEVCTNPPILWWHKSGCPYTTNKAEEIAQVLGTPPRFLLMTTYRVVIFEKQWTIELVEKMMEKAVDTSAGFHREKMVDAALMCIHIGISDPPKVHPRRVVIPLMTMAAMPYKAGTKNNFIDEQSEEEPALSVAAHSMRLYVNRLLGPLKHKKLFKQNEQGGIVSGWEEDVMKYFMSQSQALVELLDQLCEKVEECAGYDANLTKEGESCYLQASLKQVNETRFGIRRIGDMLFLVQLLLEHDLEKLARSFERGTMRQLQNMCLSDEFLYGNEKTVIQKVIWELVENHIQPSEEESLMDKLAKGASTLFCEEHRIFHKAFKMLKRSLEIEREVNRSKEVRKAVEMLKKVPHCTDMDLIAPLLFETRHGQELVELCLIVAKTKDPDDIALDMSVPLYERQKAAQDRCDCYIDVYATLQELLKIDSQADIEEIVQASAQCKDNVYLSGLFEFLGRFEEASKYLLMLDSPGLEEYLRKMSEISDLDPSTLTELTEQEIRFGRVLAQHFMVDKEFRNAAVVYKKLAQHSGDMHMTSRIELIELAKEAIGKAEDKDIEQEICDMLELFGIQLEIVDRLRSLKVSINAAEMETLCYRVDRVQYLYDTYTEKLKMYDLSLQLLSLTPEDVPSDFIQNLWDKYLIEGWLDAQSNGHSAQLNEVCRRVGHLGSKLFKNKKCFPDAHICMKLECVALKLWPHAAFEKVEECPRDHKDEILNAWYKACDCSSTAMHDVYSRCFKEEIGRHHILAYYTNQPILKWEVLRSLAKVCTLTTKHYVERRRRGLGGLFNGPSREVAKFACVLNDYAYAAFRMRPLAFEKTKEDAMGKAFVKLRAELGFR